MAMTRPKSSQVEHRGETVQKVIDDITQQDGVLSAEASWTDVPKLKGANANKQAQALANRTAVIKKYQEDSETFATLEMFGGGVGKSAASNNTAIDQIIREGFKLIRLKGQYLISRPMEFEDMSIIGDNALSTGFWATNDFSGDTMMIHYKYGGIVRGIEVSNFRLHGSGVASCWDAKRLYDGVTINSLSCIDGKPGANSVRLTGAPMTDGSPIFMGQTVTASNLLIQPRGYTSNKSALYIKDLQESVFINLKAWAGIGGQAPAHATEIVDSRSLTFITPSFVNSSIHAVRIAAETRTTRGINLYSPLYEGTIGGFIKTEGVDSFKVHEVKQDRPRLEGPYSGGYSLDNLSLSEIHTGTTSDVVLGTDTSQNQIYAFTSSGVADSGSRNSVFVMPNGTAQEEVHGQPLEIARASIPYLKYSVKGIAHDWRLAWSASNTTDSGFRLTRNNVVMYGVNAAGTSHEFFSATDSSKRVLYLSNPTSGASSLTMLVNNGTETVERRVIVGPPDSAGPGYRALYVVN